MDPKGRKLSNIFTKAQDMCKQMDVDYEDVIAVYQITSRYGNITNKKIGVSVIYSNNTGTFIMIKINRYSLLKRQFNDKADIRSLCKTLRDQYHMKQESIGSAIGRNQSSVSKVLNDDPDEDLL